MAETSGGTPSPAAEHASLKTTVMSCYVLYLVGFIVGLTAIIGVVIAYIKKSDAVGTIWESHFNNLILVFWVMFAAFIAGLASLPLTFYSLATFFENDVSLPQISLFAFPVLAVMFIYLALIIWFVYRMVRGLIRAAEDRAY